MLIILTKNFFTIILYFHLIYLDDNLKFRNNVSKYKTPH